MILVMNKLTSADEFALSAVSGWLALGLPDEARAELSQIPAERCVHPKIFLAVWDVHAHEKNWQDAVGAAEFVIALAPHLPEGYVKCAFALHELKRTAEAWKCLLPASRRFTSEWVIPYNLACYACQLGREKVAIKWLQKASEVGDNVELRAMAMADPDLAPLRQRIPEIISKRKAGWRKAGTARKRSKIL